MLQTFWAVHDDGRKGLWSKVEPPRAGQLSIYLDSDMSFSNYKQSGLSISIFPPALQLHPRYSFTKHAAVPKQILHFAYAHHQKLMAGNAQVVTQLTLAPPTKGLMKGVAGAEKTGMQAVFKQSTCWWKEDCFKIEVTQTWRVQDSN